MTLHTANLHLGQTCKCGDGKCHGTVEVDYIELKLKRALRAIYLCAYELIDGTKYCVYCKSIEGYRHGEYFDQECPTITLIKIMNGAPLPDHWNVDEGSNGLGQQLRKDG